VKEDKEDTPFLASARRMEEVVGRYADRQRQKLGDMFISWRYEVAMLVIVIISAAGIMVQIDYPDRFSPGFFLLLNLIFWLVFLIEVILKIYTYGVQGYFHDRWNTFDFIITFCCGVEIFATLFIQVRGSDLYSRWSHSVPRDFIEILRLMRLLRLARLFSQLGALLQSFLKSLSALFWIALGAFTWFYINACICTVFLGRREVLGAQGSPDPDVAEIRDRFKDVSHSLFALFEIMTLEGWTDYARPMLATHPGWVTYFIVFIFVSAFFLLNLVTAVVVDRTLAAQEEAEGEIEKTTKHQRMDTAREFVRCVRELNRGEDIVKLADLNTWSRGSLATKILEKVEEDHHFIASMVTLLDHTEEGQISLTQFEHLWMAYEQPLNTQNFVRFQINIARRMEYQERLTVTSLHCLEQLMMAQGIKSTPLHFESFEKTTPFLRHAHTSPPK
jgi:hypothetical protein